MSSVTPERQVARTVISWLRLVLPAGSIVASVETERPAAGKGNARARYGLALKRSGIVTGFPDAVAVLPQSRVLWFEWKRPDGGELSLAQQGTHQRFKTLGHPVVLATSIETARHGLRAIGVPLREDPAQLAVPARVRRAKSKWPGLSEPVSLP